MNFKNQKEELAKIDEEIKNKEAELIVKEKNQNELLTKVANLEINLQKSIPVSLKTFFQGNWVCKYRLDLNTDPSKEEFEIDGGYCKVIGNYVLASKIEYEIKNIIYDDQNKKLSFFKIRYKSDKEFESVKYVELFDRDGIYSGTEKTFYVKSPIQIIHVNYSPVYSID